MSCQGAVYCKDSTRSESAEWKEDEPVFVYSNSHEKWMPGKIYQVKKEEKMIVVQYWDILSSQVNAKAIDLDSPDIKRREIDGEHVCRLNSFPNQLWS